MTNFVLSGEILEYIGHMVRIRTCSRYTIKNIKSHLRKFHEFIFDEYEENNTLAVTTEMIYGYKQALEKTDIAGSSIDVYLQSVRLLFEWLLNAGRIEVNPFPRNITIKQTESFPKVVPSPTDIFAMRYKRGVNLRKIFIFELLLSTGMRKNELLQLRSEDIQFGNKPRSIETQRPSDVVAGAIYLDPAVGVLKGSRPRFVYISKFAMKWVKLYMKTYGIPVQSPVPLLPYCRSSVDNWLSEIGDGIIRMNPQQTATTQRTVGFTDVSTYSLKGLDPRFLAAMKRRQKAEGRKDVLEKVADSRNTKRRRGNRLHCHALRHSFTCFQYYYNWSGERNSGLRLMELLGHRELTTTIAYLQRLSLVNDMQTWRRIWLGRILDWQGWTK